MTLPEELLKVGLAWHYTHCDNNLECSRIENIAKTQQAGLWNDKNPIAPWEWRKQICRVNLFRN